VPFRSRKRGRVTPYPNPTSDPFPPSLPSLSPSPFPPPPGIGGIDDWRICTGSPAGSASRDLGYIVRYMYGAGKAPELKGAALGVFPAEASSMGYIEPFPTDPARIRSLYWQYREMKEKHKMFSAKFSAKVFHAGWSDAARLVLGHGITLPTTAEEAAAAAAGEDTTDGGGEDDDHGDAAAAAVAAASTDSARQPRPSGAGAGSGDAGGTATPRSSSSSSSSSSLPALPGDVRRVQERLSRFVGPLGYPGVQDTATYTRFALRGSVYRSRQVLLCRVGPGAGHGQGVRPHPASASSSSSSSSTRAAAAAAAAAAATVDLPPAGLRRILAYEFVVPYSCTVPEYLYQDDFEIPPPSGTLGSTAALIATLPLGLNEASDMQRLAECYVRGVEVEELSSSSAEDLELLQQHGPNFVKPGRYVQVRMEDVISAEPSAKHSYYLVQFDSVLKLGKAAVLKAEERAREGGGRSRSGSEGDIGSSSDDDDAIEAEVEVEVRGARAAGARRVVEDIDDAGDPAAASAAAAAAPAQSRARKVVTAAGPSRSRGGAAAAAAESSSSSSGPARSSRRGAAAPTSTSSSSSSKPQVGGARRRSSRTSDESTGSGPAPTATAARAAMATAGAALAAARSETGEDAGMDGGGGDAGLGKGLRRASSASSGGGGGDGGGGLASGGGETKRLRLVLGGPGVRSGSNGGGGSSSSAPYSMGAEGEGEGEGGGRGGEASLPLPPAPLLHFSDVLASSFDDDGGMVSAADSGMNLGRASGRVHPSGGGGGGGFTGIGGDLPMLSYGVPFASPFPPPPSSSGYQDGGSGGRTGGGAGAGAGAGAGGWGGSSVPLSALHLDSSAVFLVKNDGSAGGAVFLEGRGRALSGGGDGMVGAATGTPPPHAASPSVPPAAPAASAPFITSVPRLREASYDEFKAFAGQSVEGRLLQPFLAALDAQNALPATRSRFCAVVARALAGVSDRPTLERKLGEIFGVDPSSSPAAAYLIEALADLPGE
jgi:hypothetical protein